MREKKSSIYVFIYNSRGVVDIVFVERSRYDRTFKHCVPIPYEIVVSIVPPPHIHVNDSIHENCEKCT